MAYILEADKDSAEIYAKYFIREKTLREYALSLCSKFNKGEMLDISNFRVREHGQFRQKDGAFKDKKLCHDFYIHALYAIPEAKHCTGIKTKTKLRIRKIK